MTHRAGPPGQVPDVASPYLSLSRLTDPGPNEDALKSLPSTVDEICALAELQTIHHNLLGYYGLTLADFGANPRVRPPRLDLLLERLDRLEPGGLSPHRPPKSRLLGACVLESHFLTGLLRSRGVPARIRTGYFRNVMTNPSVTLPFWRGALAARGIEADLRKKDPDRWRAEVDAFTRHQFEVDHHIEHWITEFWDAETSRWTLLDANRSFLKAHSGLEVPYRLSGTYFEPAWEAWQRVRTVKDYNPDQHAEESTEGRSHVRLQLMMDFYALLNHDAAGAQGPWPEAATLPVPPVSAAFGRDELTALDELALLLSSQPSPDALKKFYRSRRRFWYSDVETDGYSFVSGVG